MDDARLCGIAGELDGRGGDGEVEHAVGPGEDRQRIVGDGDAVSPAPASSPASLPRCGEPGRSMAPAA
jgi:hypothetical protein